MSNTIDVPSAANIAEKIEDFLENPNNLVAQADVMNNKNTGWTIAAFEGLLKIMTENLKGYSQYCRRDKLLPSSCEAVGSEFLWDLSWQKRGGDESLLDLFLVCECEWGGKEEGIHHDFQKLLVARSKIYLMIFEGKTDFVISKIERLKKDISLSIFTQKDDIWILGGFCWESHTCITTRFKVDDLLENCSLKLHL